jgi:sugar phosphate isomerase/epimerase
MLEDLYIRVALERLEAEAGVIAAAGAGPEVYIPAESLRRFTPRFLADCRRILDGFPSHTLHAPFMDVWPGAADTDVRGLSLAKMRQTLDIAAELGSRLVVMHYNYDPIYYRLHFGAWLERAAEFYAALLDSGNGPLIALENIADPTPYVALQLVERAARPRLVHCFDFGHHHVFATIPFQEWLFYLKPRGHIHFHLHDNLGDSDDHLALGNGRIDWQAAKAAIAALPCPFSIALEPKSSASRDAAIAFYRENFLKRTRRGGRDA